jgi:multidrug efflux pump subunit AcrB
MWLVELALRRPFTVVIMSLLLLIMGTLAVLSMQVDIFPAIDIPVVGVVWSYPGLAAQDMETRVVLIDERQISSTVNGVARIESQSIAGVGILKIYFQQGADIGSAIAQISAVCNTAIRQMPPGMQPPTILQFNASNVPVAQLTVASKTMPEEKIFDYGQNFIRIGLFTIPGLSTPSPYGGKVRQVSIDIDPKSLEARGLSPGDVVTALQNSNVIIPAGTARIGTTEYDIATNSSPPSVEKFRAIPVRVIGGQPVLLGDVAHVDDGFGEQTNIVRVNGNRATYLAILKKSDASTLAVVQAVKDMIPEIKAAAPEGLELKLDFDQSKFVQATINGVVREALIATFLVSLLILLFLGSWRSVIIVTSSIPLAVMAALIVLKLTGNSINIMTLGGLSLAIGMLVDGATVAIENIHRNRVEGKPLTVAILVGLQQILIPTAVAILAICIVFFPVVLLTGPGRFLFVPMALFVVVAMIASFLITCTAVPMLSRLLLPGEKHHDEDFIHHHGEPQKKVGKIGAFFRRMDKQRDRGFNKMQHAYGLLLERVMQHRAFVVSVACVTLLMTFFLPKVIGTDFFPSTDTGLMKMHMRAPVGTRIEETERIAEGVEQEIHSEIPASELETVNDMIGVPPNSYNLAFITTDNASGMDVDFLISLKEGHKPTVAYMDQLRKELPAKFPGSSFYFQPADIVSQVLNFGLSAPLDVQVEYKDLDKAYTYAKTLRDEMKKIPGTADVNIKQVLDYPTLRVHVDRVRASRLGLSERDVANSMLISLSSSSLVAPSYFVNPNNNVNYNVVVQTPLDKLNSVDNLLRTPLTSTLGRAVNAKTDPSEVPHAAVQTLGNVVSLTTEVTPNQVNHHTVQRVIDVTSSVEGRDLGSVSSDIEAAIGRLGKLPPGMRITVRGQNEVMNESFRSLGLGIILAIILVYLLLVMLFQSWLDPFITMIAVPGALIGILWMLAVTGTTINVVSLMGSIMTIGIAVSNSILLVSFANDIRVEKNIGALQAAIEAGKTRMRPVLMTALAMIIGMIPMALAYGEGGEQNAPLARAVIGGLIVATVVTLFIVPIVYSLLRKELPRKHMFETRFRVEKQGMEYNGETDNAIIDTEAAEGLGLLEA